MEIEKDHQDPIPLNEFRDYLLVLARGQIPDSLAARLDASDIVQDTLLEAHAKREQFRGGTDSRILAGWLRQMLSSNLIDAIRFHQRGGRDVNREKNVAKLLDESAMQFENLLKADDTSPSQKVERHWQSLRIASAIENLPESQRQAILLRYFRQASLEEISTTMKKPKTAVAGLLKRGLAGLRKSIIEEKN